MALKAGNTSLPDREVRWGVISSVVSKELASVLNLI